VITLLAVGAENSADERLVQAAHMRRCSDDYGLLKADAALLVKK
jgi:hypothetical protein